MGTHTCRVELKTDDLISALRSLKAAQRVGKIVRVTFRDEQLEFTRGETAARVPATGTWPMSAGVAVRLVKDLLSRDRSLPATLVVTGSDTMLHFNHVDELLNFAFHYAIPCSWETPYTGSAASRKPAPGPPTIGQDDGLLQKIADLGGLDPVDLLRHLVSPEHARSLDLRGPLLREVLAFLVAHPDPERDATVKGILWDARAAILDVKNMSAEERAWRLGALDMIGRIVFAS